MPLDVQAATPGGPLRVEGLSRAYAGQRGPIWALEGISFQVAPAEFVCIVGASGCGKTTLLRILGGLLAPTRGRVFLGSAPVTSPRAGVGSVFQRANLMPWRTVLQNVALPLEVAGMPGSLAAEQARPLIELVGLTGYEHLYPRQLSGGMQQRAVLARALIHQPSLLLLDEPFGALDALTRERMNLELQRIWSLQHPMVVMVTHSIAEALFLADRVLVMQGPPGQIAVEITVDLDRPRALHMMSGEKFGDLATRVRQAIGKTE
jgi:NitT/TauT family transport system ATP-binding protein